MQGIYQPKGKAREYCENAVNLYIGCGHKCSYCYSPRILYMTQKSFSTPSPRINIIDQIRKDAPKYAGKEVLLCFTCDPYQVLNNYELLTRRALEVLFDNLCRVSILTKGGMRSLQDFDILKRNIQKVKYGATLTFLKEEISLLYEPGASMPSDRIFALDQAKKIGLSTWASLEPVIDPEQSLEIIRETKDIVDVFMVGKWNYDAASNLIDWKDFGERAVSLLKKYRKKYYIKKDLAAYLQ